MLKLKIIDEVKKELAKEIREQNVKEIEYKKLLQSAQKVVDQLSLPLASWIVKIIRFPQTSKQATKSILNVLNTAVRIVPQLAEQKSSEKGSKVGSPESTQRWLKDDPKVDKSPALALTADGGLWTHFEPTLDQLWTDSGPTLDLLWTNFGLNLSHTAP